ncbi:MAG: thiaminase II [Hyphomicrobiales bacterium]|nr:thiaminase II [Hyphomicrobiales bacterium]
MAPQDTLFARLRGACAGEWRAYVEHPFVAGLADGTLPQACFRHYLVQDYLFLIHFARAYALAAYKADTLDDIRQATEGLKAIVDVEMGLHVTFCAGWGLDEAAMAAAPEADATMAYTRYVLEKGLAGDLLDLHVALAPCIVGYGEIGARLAADPATRTDGNPYAAWIEMYASAEYQEVAAAEVAHLDRLMARRGGPGRLDGLVTTFRQATRLEAAFWDMGMSAPAPGR